MNDSLLYVDSACALQDLSRRLRNSAWVALDTEFRREKTFYPQLCLLQVATDELIAWIDPLTLDEPDLEPLFDVLYNPAITKILHAAQQDLEILYQRRGEVPGPVFDTQIAASLAGYGDQVSYAMLVKSVLSISLDKGQTRTDWSRRPLAPKQLTYAADDVRYLGALYRHLREHLQAQGRWAWIEEDCAMLADAQRYRLCPQRAWMHIKGHGRLRGVQLAVLRELAIWREHQASREDRPRQWIIRDAIMLDLARRMPDDWAQLGKVPGLERRRLEAYGSKLLELIVRARNEPQERWPRPAQRAPLGLEREALVDALMAAVRLTAASHGVSVNVLASRSELERLVLGDNELALLRGWRRALVGQLLQGLLSGRLRLEVDAGKLVLSASDYA